MEHLNTRKVLPHHGHLLRRWFWHLHSVLCRRVWSTNLHQTQYYLSNSRRIAVLYCTFDAVLNLVSLLVWNRGWGGLSSIKKIYLWNYASIKQIDTIDQVKDIFCNWLSLRIFSSMVFALKSSLEMASVHHLHSKHLWLVRDRSKW